VNWQLAGRTFYFEPAGYWQAAVLPAGQKPADAEGWQEPWGDRRQELVFIGQDLRKDQLLGALQACLLTDKEMAGGPEAWARMDDPLPEWPAVTEPDVPEDDRFLG
jgi:hypothetical protein